MNADARLFAGLLDGDEKASLALDPKRKSYVHLVRGELEVNGQKLRDRRRRDARRRVAADARRRQGRRSAGVRPGRPDRLPGLPQAAGFLFRSTFSQPRSYSHGLNHHRTAYPPASRPARRRTSLALVGRILIAYLFIPAGFGKLMGFAGTVGYIASAGLPLPRSGRGHRDRRRTRPRHRACCSASRRASPRSCWPCSRVAAAVFFHKYWAAPDAMKMMQTINFNKNIAIAGGLLALAAFGAGRSEHRQALSAFARGALAWPTSSSFSIPATATPSAWRRPWPTAPAPQLLAIDADGNLPAGGWEMLAAADAIIFGAPTYMGGAELAVQEVRRCVVQGLVRRRAGRTSSSPASPTAPP